MALVCSAACGSESRDGLGLPREHQSCLYRLNGFGQVAGLSTGTCLFVLSTTAVTLDGANWSFSRQRPSIFWCSRTDQGLFPVDSVDEATFLLGVCG